MKLKKVIFYQSVRLWNNQEYHTVNEGENKGLGNIDIILEEHLVKVIVPGLETIVVPTANMRMGIELGVENEAVVAEEIKDLQEKITEALKAAEKPIFEKAAGQADTKKKGRKQK